MKRYIELNGTDITSGNYRVNEISFDNAPPMNLNTLDIPRKDGTKLVSANYSPKRIDIQGRIEGTDSNNLDSNLDDFKKAISGSEVDLNVVVNQKARIWKVATEFIDIGNPRLTYHLTFIPYSLTLMALDPPFGTDSTWSSVFSANDRTEETWSTDLTLGGTITPRPHLRYRVDVPGSLETLICKSENTNRQMEIHTAWEAGDLLDINCEDRTVFLNDLDKQFNGVFPEFEVGVNRLRTMLLASNTKAVSQELWNSHEGFHKRAGRRQLAQQFEIPATTTYTHLEIPLISARRRGEPGAFELTIQTDSGSNTPSGTVVTDSTIDDDSVNLPNYPDFRYRTFRFVRPISLTAGSKYWIVLRHTETDPPKGSNGIHWRKHTENKYADGIAVIRKPDNSWTTAKGDFCFRVYRNISEDWTIDLQVFEKPRYL